MRIRGGIGIAPAACVAALAACASGSRDGSVFGDSGYPGYDAGSSGELSGQPAPCKNLQCQQVDCAQSGQPDTTVTGIVLDPAGRNPLYNVIVYVPNAPVKPFQSGAVCDQCGVTASGEPLVTTLTGSDGRFTLTNVPAGGNIPLVLQLGKWRKQVFVPHVAACAETTMDDPQAMRLPAKKSEGDMPQLAVATGGRDAFECLLRKIGVDDSEFTDETGKGRVHVYQGVGGTPLATRNSSAADLWSSESLLSYDMIINACECSEAPDEKPQSSIDNLVAYANGGGRVFNTHYHYYWIDPTKIMDAPVIASNPAWQSTATFIPEVDGTNAIYGIIDESFPKGRAFAEWLANVGGSLTAGSLPIDQARYNVTAATPPSTPWVSNPNVGQTLAGGNALLHYTFNTPVGEPTANQCGKVLFSDFHVVAADGLPVSFPDECDPGPMTPQELALEFMLFDLSACVQEDSAPPPLPPPASQ